MCLTAHKGKKVYKNRFVKKIFYFVLLFRFRRNRHRERLKIHLYKHSEQFYKKSWSVNSIRGGN